MKKYRSDKLIERGKTLHIFSTAFDTAVPPHTHDFIELIYYSRGRCRELIDGVEYIAERGDILFLSAGSVHEQIPEGEAEHVTVCFSADVIDDSILTRENASTLLSLIAYDKLRCETNTGMISFSGKERREIETILSAMLDEYCRKEDSWNTVMESYLAVIITKMMRHARLGITSEELSGLWQELSEYIENNLDSELSLTSLAARYFYNPSYFSRIFKEKFGSSLIDYVNSRRIEEAMRRLREEDLSVTEIYPLVGFSDRRSFYHAFKKHAGCTPSEYRKVKK